MNLKQAFNSIIEREAGEAKDLVHLIAILERMKQDILELVPEMNRMANQTEEE